MTQAAVKYREHIVPSKLRSSPTMSATKGIDLSDKAVFTVGDIFEKPTAQEIAGWEADLRKAANDAPDDKKYKIEEQVYKYAGGLGTDGFRAAAAYKFTEDSGIKVEAKDVGVGTGAKGALNAVASKFEPNDVVFVASPGWPTNFDVFPAGVKIIEVDTDGRGLINSQQLEQLLEKYPKAKGILINTPSNPTGAVYKPDEREELMKVIKEKASGDFLAILDNPYGKIVYNGKPPKRGEVEKELFDQGKIAEIRSMSKEYGLAGLRVGYAVSKNPEIIEQVGKWNESRGGLTAITQNIAQAALLFGEPYIERNVEDLRKKRQAMMDGIKDLGGLVTADVPDGAIYSFPNFKKLKGMVVKDGYELKNLDDINKFLINEAKIVGISGKPFYAPENAASPALKEANDDCHARWCFSGSLKVITEAMARLKNAVGNLVDPNKRVNKGSSPDRTPPR